MDRASDRITVIGGDQQIANRRTRPDPNDRSNILPAAARCMSALFGGGPGFRSGKKEAFPSRFSASAGLAGVRRALLPTATAVVLFLSPETVRSALAATGERAFRSRLRFSSRNADPARFSEPLQRSDTWAVAAAADLRLARFPRRPQLALAFGPRWRWTFRRRRRGRAFLRIAYVWEAPRVRRPRSSHSLLGELAALLPAALTAGAAMQLTAWLDLSTLPSPLLLAGGALLGFAAAPCGLGAVAIAGALRVRAPLAAIAFLCVAGIVDARTLGSSSRSHAGEHDALAYALLALALGIVASHHGDALVHPAIAGALGLCAVAAATCAGLHRKRQNARMRPAPLIMLLSALIAAPPPAYRATETTVTDLFPAERLTFTGVLSRDAHAAALVRYAVTCCRADAAPVVVRLTRPPAFAPGTWLRVDGVVESRSGEPAAGPAARRPDRSADRPLHLPLRRTRAVRRGCEQFYRNAVRIFDERDCTRSAG